MEKELDRYDLYSYGFRIDGEFDTGDVYFDKDNLRINQCGGPLNYILRDYTKSIPIKDEAQLKALYYGLNGKVLEKDMEAVRVLDNMGIRREITT
jgi:hypothetical protein